MNESIQIIPTTMGNNGSNGVFDQSLQISMAAHSIRRQIVEFSGRGIPAEQRQEELLSKYKDRKENLSPKELNRTVSKEKLKDTNLHYKNHSPNLTKIPLIVVHEKDNNDLNDSSHNDGEAYAENRTKLASPTSILNSIDDYLAKSSNYKKKETLGSSNLKYNCKVKIQSDSAILSKKSAKLSTSHNFHNDSNLEEKVGNDINIPLYQVDKQSANNDEIMITNNVSKSEKITNIPPLSERGKLLRSSSEIIRSKMATLTQPFKSNKVRIEEIIAPEEIVANERKELKCTICNMAFDDMGKKNKHIKYSTLHSNCMIKANKEYHKDGPILDNITPNPGVPIYFEHKLYWRTKDHLDIHVVMHHSHCGKKIFEVIPYDTVAEIEWKRIYLDIPTLISSIGQERFNTAIIDAVKGRRRSSLLSRLYTTEKTEEELLVLGELPSRMRVLCQLVITRLLSMSLCDPINGSRSKELVYSLGPGDSARSNPVLYFSELPCDTLIPVTIEHVKKREQEEISATVVNISVLNRQVSENRFKAEGMIDTVVV